MKRLELMAVAVLIVMFYPGSGVAYAQHGHGGNGGAGIHGASGRHGEDGSGGAGHSSNAMSSRNPGEVLDHNEHLAGKLEGLLGLSGPNALSMLKADASGFKNFGQFVAAVHVSHNLGIPFSALRARMTGPHAVSLGNAIRELKAGANARAEAKKATMQAKIDIRSAS